MNYPDFFNKIPTIKLKDELSNTLGAFENGIIEFSYLDIVKSAGHSCPTVLGAYLMTFKALDALYENDIPNRGEIKIEFPNKQTESTTGVIANVISNITGATFENGFKGLAGNFDRRYLMFFEKEISSDIKFTRLDTNKSVGVFYNPNSIEGDSSLPVLMQKVIAKKASDDELKEFKKLWQKRVESIAMKVDEVVTLKF